jgi:single-stranded-DNA-specific exonuclease
MNNKVFKKITLREQKKSFADDIVLKHGIHPVTSRVLAARGFSSGKELDDFLEPTLKSGLPDPIDLKNAFKGAELIRDSILANEKIALCCDFDVDGLSGGSLMCAFLQDLGAEVKVYVPDRFKEGYGLNTRMIDQAISEDRKLLITIDYGTSNSKELEYAKSLSLKTMVIDHHHIASGQTSPADVFVNPHQDGCNFCDCTLCAAGLVWYVAAAVRKLMPEQAKHIDIRTYLEFACLGTICDMVPLKGANRVIAKKGLELLSFTKRPGLIALKEVASIYGKIKGSHVGFGLGPRINAAGRMLSGEIVIELLTTNCEKTAKKIASKLDELNSVRQETEKRIKVKVIDSISNSKELPSGIVVWDEHYHTGVIGIVAQRLVETFYRPSIVCGKDGDFFKGSVRGIKGFNVVETLSLVKEHLEHFGGHEGAGGFSIKPENLENLKRDFNEICREILSTIETSPVIQADTEVTLSDLDEDLVLQLNSFSPFGISNPAPQLVINNLEVKEVQSLKNQHTKAVLSDDKCKISALLWRETEHPALYKGAKVKIACRPEVNAFYGKKSLQLNLQAVEEIIQ